MQPDISVRVTFIVQTIQSTSHKIIHIFSIYKFTLISLDIVLWQMKNVTIFYLFILMNHN